MKIYSLPSTISSLVFDIDMTLYRCETYYGTQKDLQVKRLASLRGETLHETEAKLNEVRQQYSKENQGRGLSLGNTFKEFGIPIETSVQWRKELFHPEHFLKQDKELQKTLDLLSSGYSLICVTNNPAQIGRRTIKALGVEDYFIDVIGLDHTMVSKPHRAPYELALEKLNTLAGNCVSIGDRYTVDLEAPLEMGMGGILVESMDDVYSLPDILIKG
ncbi:MAG: HAD family hydrolase [Spirochaetia bacterium]